MARLVVSLRDAATGAVLPYTYVEADGIAQTTGLDGTATFELPLGRTVIVRVRHVAYRPWSQSVSMTTERVEVPANLEKAIL